MATDRKGGWEIIGVNLHIPMKVRNIRAYKNEQSDLNDVYLKPSVLWLPAELSSALCSSSVESLLVLTILSSRSLADFFSIYLTCLTMNKMF